MFRECGYSRNFGLLKSSSQVSISNMTNELFVKGFGAECLAHATCLENKTSWGVLAFASGNSKRTKKADLKHTAEMAILCLSNGKVKEVNFQLHLLA